MGSGPAHQGFERAGLYGLFQKPECSQLVHSLDGAVHGAIRGEDDGRRAVPQVAEFVEQLETIHAGHVEIGKDDVGRNLGQLLQGVHAIGGGIGGHAPGSDHAGQACALTRLIVYDQDSQGLVHGYQSLLYSFRA